MIRSTRVAVIAIAALALCAAGTSYAQTTKTELRTVTIIGVSGDTVQFTNAKGETKEYTVPMGMKLMQDGKEISVADLKPGMKVTAVVEMTTKAVPVTTTHIRNGRVIRASGGTLVVEENHKLKMYKVPPGYQFIVNGQPTTVDNIQQGMTLNATIVSKETKFVTEQEVKKAYAAAPAPPPAPKAAAPPPPPPPAAAPAPPPPPPPAPAPAPKKLPKTASPVPLAGLAGALSLLAGLGLRFRRSR
jgi:translation elongation factor P/translation initiation factor 5A